MKIYKYSSLIVVVLMLAISATGQTKIDGTYYRIDGNADVTFKTVKRGTNFMIVVSGDKPGICIGEAKGKIEWLTGDVAIVSKYDFQDGFQFVLDMAIVFSRNQAKITEMYHSGFHGVACDFHGIYKKRTRKRK